MYELRKLETGVSTKFAVMDENGGEMVFKLAIISRPGYLGEDRRYEFAYINDDGFGKITRVRGTYSGGVTGSGSELRDMKALEEGEIVETTDLAEIRKMAEDASNKEKKDRDALIARKQKAVEQLNKLPEVFFRCEIRGIVWTIKRGKFEYNPTYSESLRGGYSVFRGSDFDRSIYISNYYRKDGVMMKKRVAEDAKYLVGAALLNDAIDLVACLKEKIFDAQKQIGDIWNKAKYGNK